MDVGQLSIASLSGISDRFHSKNSFKSPFRLPGVVKGQGNDLRGGPLLSRENLYSSQQADQFIRQNQDLLSVIDQSEEAKDFLKKKDISSRKDLVSVIAQTASSLLQGEAAGRLNAKTLESKPRLASLIVLNTGGLRDLINQDSQALKTLTDASQAPETALFEELGKKASDLFEENHPLKDADFFKSHPSAAIYLLDRPDQVRTLSEDSDSYGKARDFKAGVDSVATKSLLNEHVVSFATQAVGSGNFPKEFFENHIEAAEYASAGEFVSNIPSPADYLKSHPSFSTGSESNLALGEKFDFHQLTRDVLLSQAQSFLSANASITREDLRSETGLAALLLTHKGLRTAIHQEAAQESSRGVDNLSTLSVEIKNLVKENFHSTYENPRGIVSLVL